MTPLYLIISISFVILIQLTSVNGTVAGGWTEIPSNDEKLRDYAAFAAGNGNTIKIVLSGARQVI